jgi:acetyl-CoA/propionyl-CoA carboxylase biotin carboxyl carrier protein
VLPFHRAVVRDPAFADPDSLRVHTRWIETEFSTVLPPQEVLAVDDPPAREKLTVEVGGKRLEVVLPASAAAPASAGPAERSRRTARKPRSAPTAGGGNGLVSPMQGTIIKIAVADGASVLTGDVVVVLEAMKMEQPLVAHKEGTVSGLSVAVGQTVSAGTVICTIE